jgi:hypothetical protein
MMTTYFVNIDLGIYHLLVLHSTSQSRSQILTNLVNFQR